MVSKSTVINGTLGTATVVCTILAVVFAIKANPLRPNSGKSVLHNADTVEYTSGYFKSMSADEINEIKLPAHLDEIFERLTAEQKIGQLTQWADGLESGPNGSTAYVWQNEIVSGRLGSVINIKDPAEIEAAQEAVMNSVGIPLVFGYDVIRGYKTIFPNSLALAASWDPEMVKDASYMAARESIADGIYWTFAPMIDTARDARWGRMAEGFGEDPLLVTHMGIATVDGLQSAGMAACPKHLLGYGGTWDGRDYSGSDHSWKFIMEEYGIPFRDVIEKSNPWSLMSAYTTYNFVAAHGSKELHTDLARGEWGFNGMYISDIYGARELLDHRVAEDRIEGGVQALQAGVDMDMSSFTYHMLIDHWDKVVGDGQTIGKLIDTSVRRALLFKDKMGLFENKGMPTREFDWSDYPAEHAAAARAAVPKSSVLLVNRNKALPIAKDQDRVIKVVGHAAIDHVSNLGFWHAMGMDMEPHATSILDAMKQVCEANRCTVDYTEGNGISFGPWPNVKNEEWLAAVTPEFFAGATDIVLVMGENNRLNGEASGRPFLELPFDQPEIVRRALAYKQDNEGVRVHLIMNVGRPNIITEFLHPITGVDSVLVPWTAGSMAGPGIADMVFGDYTPSGHLPVVWPRHQGQLPMSYQTRWTNRPWSFDDETSYLSDFTANPQPEGLDGLNKVFTHFYNRWTDYTESEMVELPDGTTELYTPKGDIRPAFDFGYGLSYDNLKVEGLTYTTGGDNLVVSGLVTRESTTRGAAEVVQVYAAVRFSKFTPVRRRLIGYARVDFGDSGVYEKDFTINVNLREAVTRYDLRAKKFYDNGVYDFYVGTDTWDNAELLVEGMEIDFEQDL